MILTQELCTWIPMCQQQRRGQREARLNINFKKSLNLRCLTMFDPTEA